MTRLLGFVLALLLASAAIALAQECKDPPRSPLST
jgi:hypothetical protein